MTGVSGETLEHTWAEFRSNTTPELARTAQLHVESSLLGEYCERQGLSPGDLRAVSVNFVHHPLQRSPTDSSVASRRTIFGHYQRGCSVIDGKDVPYHTIKLDVPKLIEYGRVGISLAHETSDGYTDFANQNVSSTLMHELMHYAQRLGKEPEPMPRSRRSILLSYSRSTAHRLSETQEEETRVRLYIKKLLQLEPCFTNLVQIEMLTAEQVGALDPK